MPTLRERLVLAAQQGGTVTFVGPDEPVTVPWAELHADATRVAATLQAQGVRVGDHVAFMYLGDLVEYGPTEQVFSAPKAERTRDYVRGSFG